jgi:hypothetical protein
MSIFSVDITDLMSCIHYKSDSNENNETNRNEDATYLSVAIEEARKAKKCLQ